MSDTALGSFTTFGELLKHLRRRARLTQRELGLAVGYSEAHITRLENGQRTPDPNTVKGQFVEALGLQREPDTAQRLLALAEQASIRNAGTEVDGVAEPVPPPNNLPAQLTSFVGRSQEMAEVQRLLGTTRLLTLTGSGGCGKTRLALEVAATIVGAMHRPPSYGEPEPMGGASPLPAFSDGVWLVELAPLADPALVANTAAAVFNLPLVNRPALDVLRDALLHKTLLLILDNCEHLIGACAELVDALLPTCPHLHVLVTSREGLNVPGEVTWRVPSLAAPEAVRLFADRARAAQPAFALTPANTPVVAHICRRLDHIPLAVELAAARTRTFTVEQTAARLDDAFRLLTTGSRTALPRQQTLRATIDWSYGLLSEDERTFLQRLSVFAGGWTLEAAEALSGAEAVDLLDRLVGKSLVQADQAAAEPRYRMLEMVRQYAHEKLVAAGEHEQAHGSHLEFFASLVQAAQSQYHGPHELEWVGRLDVEVDNLRAALDWAAQTGDLSAGRRLVDGLWWWWMIRGYLLEGQRWVDLALPDDCADTSSAAESAARSAARATAQMASGWLAIRLFDYAHALECFSRAIPLAYRAKESRLIAYALAGLGYVTLDHEEGVRLLNEALHLSRQNGWAWETALAELFLGIRFRTAGNYEYASRHLREALTILHTLGETGLTITSLWRLGQTVRDSGDDAEAGALFERALTLARRLRDPVGIARNLVELAAVALQRGDAAGALPALKESIVIFRDMDSKPLVGKCTVIAAGVSHLRGDPQRAAALLGFTDALFHSSEYYSGESELWQEHHHLLPLVRAALDPADFERAWAQGQQMTLQQVIDDVMAM
jgi:non-specific serine/threonine protein kinase